MAGQPSYPRGFRARAWRRLAGDGLTAARVG